jgi:hypothetical protein
MCRPSGLQQSNILDDVLVTVQKNLYALKDFLDKNPHLFHSSPGDPAAARAPGGNDQEAWKVSCSLMVYYATMAEYQILRLNKTPSLSFKPY